MSATSTSGSIFGLLHLSDIHLKRGPNVVLNRINRIADAAAGSLTGVAEIAVAITGDIAFSGKRDEYNIAGGFVQTLRERLGQRNLKIGPVVVVPGNHDCNFESAGAVRQGILSSLDKFRIDGRDTSVVDQCTGVQDEFFSFLATVEGTGSSPTGYQRLKFMRTFALGPYRIRFHCLNTAWMSQLAEVQGKLVFPESALMEDLADADAIIALFHHPYNWLASDSARSFRAFIERTSDVVLTGHEHEGSAFSRKTLAGGTHHYVEGAVLQESGSNRSGFNAVLIDPPNRRWKVIQSEWSDESSLFEPTESAWQEFTRQRTARPPAFELTEEFSEWLDDPGIGFTHPRVGAMRLRDFYVFPDVDDQPFAGDAANVIFGERFLNYVAENSELLVLGAEKSGKTSLCKALYGDFIKQGFAPILLSGTEIKSAKDEKVAATVQRSITRQYGGDSVTRLVQHPRESKVLLIDDFHLAKLNARGREKFIAEVSRQFGRVIITSDVLLQVGELAEAESDSEQLLNYRRCFIRQLGHTLRSDLIERWIRLGQDEELEEEELARKTAEVEKTVETVLGKNVVPSQPVFILSMVQFIEAGAVAGANSGSFGYVYEALITAALANEKTSISIDTRYTFLSLVAKRLFENDGAGLSDGEFARVTAEYFEKYRVSFSVEDMLSTLRSASILARDRDGTIRFKYRYVYYYFAARALQDLLKDDQKAGRDVVDTLAARLGEDEAAQILIFLIYLTKDQYILDKMLEIAAASFADFQPVNLDNDVREITNISEMHGPEYVEEDVRSTKRKRLRERDTAEFDLEREAARPVSGRTVEEQYEAVQALGLANRTVVILGQVLRNFHGSLRADVKERILREAYGVGLRSLGAIVGSIAENYDVFLKVLGGIIRKMEKKKRSPEDVEKLAREVSFWLVLAVAFSQLRTIASAVGSEYLFETYKDVRGKAPTVAVSLLDMAIRLENAKIQEEDVVALYKVIREKSLAVTILKKFVLDYLYFFPTDRAVRQRLCDSLGIPRKALAAINPHE